MCDLCFGLIADNSSQGFWIVHISLMIGLHTVYASGDGHGGNNNHAGECHTGKLHEFGHLFHDIRLFVVSTIIGHESYQLFHNIKVNG